MVPPPPESKRASHIITFVTLVLSVACLAWALHGVSWTELWEEIRELDWRWVAVAAIADLLVYVVQGWRWSLLLLPVGEVTQWGSIGAIYVGLFANEVLPLRAGELIRCFLMARWSKVPISVTLASALIERIFDGVLLIVGLFLSLRYIHGFPLNHGQTRAIEILTTGSVFLAILILLCAALLAVAMYWREQTLDALLDARIVLLGARVHRRSASHRTLTVSVLSRRGEHSFSARPDRPHLRHHAGLWLRRCLLVASRCSDRACCGSASVVPQAPGNVGLFQVLSTLGLTLFGVPAAMARRFTLILWAVITVPLLIVGFVALVASGSKMGDIHREAQAEMRARQDELAKS